ncbi:MAG: PEP-CTERM sorting domain-containing protein [Pirellulales bacterium]
MLGNPSSGLYDATDVYAVAGGFGVATLDPLHPTEQLNPTANFTAVLTAAYTGVAGWGFPNSAAELTNNSLEVRTYDVQGIPARVGADFYIQYNPGVGDPTAATHDIHWIQVVTDNHQIAPVNLHGVNENIVDVGVGQANPYYDDGGAANSTQFFDFPGRGDTTRGHTWKAELFLASTPKGSGLGAQNVTLWSGVNWGWQNYWSIPEPSSVVLSLIGLVGLLGYAWRKHRTA